MKSVFSTVAACFTACFLLAGCDTNPNAGGEKLAGEQAYAPTGTFIPRKNGTGLGGSQIETVRKQDLENQRNMGSSDQVGAAK